MVENIDIMWVVSEILIFFFVDCVVINDLVVLLSVFSVFGIRLIFFI